MITETAEGAYRVSCEVLDCPRPLMRVVVTEAHARNLARKHAREYHGEGPQFTADEVDELTSIIDASRDDGPSVAARAILAAGYAKAPF